MVRADGQLAVPVEPVPVPVPVRPRPATPLQEVAREIPLPREGMLSIAAVWGSSEGRVDIDLWVKPTPQAAEINFKNKKTPEGQLLRTFLPPPQGHKGRTWAISGELVGHNRTAIRDTPSWPNRYAQGWAGSAGGLVWFA